MYGRAAGVKHKIILSLCDFTGASVLPYHEAGYHVIQVDPKLEDYQDENITRLSMTAQDLLSIIEFFPEVHGLIMMPVCTDFTVSCSRLWKVKDQDGRTDKSLELVIACLNIKDIVRPAWWMLENPVGRLPSLLPDRLGRPVMYFNPCDYGDPYNKKTGLWGDFIPPLPLFIGEDRSVKPIKVSSQGSWIMKLGGSSEKTKALRSVTPAGFALAFYDVNP